MSSSKDIRVTNPELQGEGFTQTTLPAMGAGPASTTASGSAGPASAGLSLTVPALTAPPPFIAAPPPAPLTPPCRGRVPRRRPARRRPPRPGRLRRRCAGQSQRWTWSQTPRHYGPRKRAGSHVCSRHCHNRSSGRARTGRHRTKSRPSKGQALRVQGVRHPRGPCLRMVKRSRRRDLQDQWRG